MGKALCKPVHEAVPAAVLSQFEAGVQYIDDLMTILDSGSKDVKGVIENAYEAFLGAERELKQHIHTLTKVCLAKEAELSQKQSQHQQLVVSLAALSASLDPMRSNLEEQTRRVSSAEEDVQKAEQSVQTAREEFQRAEKHRNDVRTAGLGLIWIPVVGATMLAVSETALNKDVENAEHCLNSVRSTLSNAKDTLSVMSNDCQQTENELRRQTDEKANVAPQISQIGDHIQVNRDYLTEQNSSLTKMRKVIHTLSMVAERAEILRDETKIMYEIAQIGEPLKSLVDGLEKAGVTTSDVWIKVLSRPAFKAIGAAGGNDW